MAAVPLVAVRLAAVLTFAIPFCRRLGLVFESRESAIDEDLRNDDKPILDTRGLGNRHCATLYARTTNGGSLRAQQLE